MTAHDHIDFQFVEAIPETVDAGVVYISVVYATTAHSCACGCGSEVVLPLSPRDWSVTFDGETVSLSPSVWNRRMPYGAHYWIRRNKIVWVPDGELEKEAAVNWLVRTWRRVLGRRRQSR
jgi:hypothetical protein